MNWLDFVIIVVIVWYAFWGLSSGLLLEVVMLLASVLGVILAGRLYQRLAGDIQIVHNDARLDQLIAFIVIFAAVVLAGQIAGLLLRESVHERLFLGSVDRLGGLVVGLLQGAVIVELIIFAFATFPAAGWMTAALNSSLLAPIFLHGAPWLLHVLPGVFRQGVQAF